MSEINFGIEYMKELNAEIPATRHCLERIPETLWDWKPHEKSMVLGYLAQLVAEIPLWIVYMADQSEIDFVTFEHFKPKTNAELVKHFDENVEGAKKSLSNISNAAIAEPFYLKANGQVVYSAPKKINISSAINHMVHHRGQLTVYMRLNNIPVPSIYGPSADDKGF